MKKALSKKNIWESSPSWLKATLSRGLGEMPLAWLLGKGFRNNCEFVQSTQWWSAECIKEYQLNRLREILKLAYEKTVYYHRVFDSIGLYPTDIRSLKDINQLPIIDKQVVVDNLSDMCTKSVTASDLDYVSTGGTSGIPLQFYINANRSAVEYAYLTTSWQRVGYKLGMPVAVLRGRTVNPDRNGLRHEYDPIFRHHYYSNFHMSDENMARYLEHISTIGPCFLHVYPSSIATLAHFIIQSKTCTPRNIKGIIAESEIVYPQQRQMVEKVFGCRYFSCYGQSEKLVLATGCEKNDDYHVWPTYGYFELLDENDNPVTTPGKRGEIIGTGFINTVMPFIRYRTGDRAAYVGDHCQGCGRQHTVIRDIRGHRTQEVLITGDGSEISWTALNMHDNTFMHVKQFQFFQETPGCAILHIVPSGGFGEEDVKRIQQNLGCKFDGQLDFTIKSVETIPLTARGKAIYVDQRIQDYKKNHIDQDLNS